MCNWENTLFFYFIWVAPNVPVKALLSTGQRQVKPLPKDPSRSTSPMLEVLKFLKMPAHIGDQIKPTTYRLIGVLSTIGAYKEVEHANILS